MFRKMPFILLFVIFFAFVFDNFIPLEIKSFLYAVSLSIKSIIVFLLPCLIFMLLFKTLTRLSRNATKLIFIVLIGVCCSNFLSTLISYPIGAAIFHLDLSIITPHEAAGLMPLWSFSLPKLIANDRAMFLGLILGILGSLYKPALSEKISAYFEKAVNFTFGLLVYAIPFFVLGFVVKLIHEKMLANMIKDYALIFAIVALAQLSYISLIYLAVNRFRLSGFMSSIKNMVPSAIAGFGSMSSAAAMPLTLIGTEKNVRNPETARLVIPTTVNIHLIGDCFAIPIFAFAVMKNFGAPEPAFLTYLLFAVYFVIAKFSVAAIPGGGIIVMLPLLESQLGFTGEMASMITALYILFDPVITCANVCGNGGFAMALGKFIDRNFKKTI